PASDPPTGGGVAESEEVAPARTATLERKQVAVEGEEYALEHGSVVIAAITSCTNTSNPSVMIAAGLLAQKAVERGLERRPWVKSSLAPGSKVVSEYYRASGLDRYLDELGFNTVGYGCTTCIGNSGPLPEPISAAVAEGDLVVCAVLVTGDEGWRELDTPEGELYAWDESSTYVRLPPYFEGMPREPAPVEDVEGARCLVLLGDSVTTDHISPAGAIRPDSPAGKYL